MLEILKFIFSNFWIWLGVIIIIAVICDGIAKIIVAVRKPEVLKDEYKKMINK